MYRWPISNVAIIAGTVLFYFNFQGDALSANTPSRILEIVGDYSRNHPMILDCWDWTGMLGHVLLHADVFHLAGNMLFLWVFGNAICAKVGNVSYLVLYLSLAWCAAAAHLYFDGDPAIGASGAIKGIVGMFLVYYPLNSISCVYWFYWRGGTFSVSSYWMILLWLSFDVWGVVVGYQGVGYWAHIGGLAAGAVLASVLLTVRLVRMDELEKSIFQVVGKQFG
jgi:membrane associated rhomboid family serine protease